ncbi:MAG TPA: wax ester/triacylglycerol synthase domain-containing protein [Ramlibacter sp.]|nr:wax ester/triacylglycerol synthase domain-containing protein [Ramlibacter sp.]
MRSLSGLDATFLYLETPQTPMHVGSLHLCELPKGLREVSGAPCRPTCASACTWLRSSASGSPSRP